MAYLVGVIASFLCIRLSLFFLEQSFSMYFDDVAITMVVGGTIAIGIVDTSLAQYKNIYGICQEIIFPSGSK